ncbi:MAG: type II toxin-antitoxin system RelE/ParE family toxin [Sphingomonadaceae bacterium]|nr:type II toxin-antitoxin system RelE/ParE family toxin [Sphingomonadaceae bacterium]
MRGVRWADQALQDLVRIYEFYADTAPLFPPALLDRIDRLVPILLAFPNIAAPIEGVPFRKMRFRGTDFILFYRPTEDGIEIARLFHAGRDVRA